MMMKMRMRMLMGILMEMVVVEKGEAARLFALPAPLTDDELRWVG